MRLHAFIAGDVQGVGFRYTTKRYADSVGVTGWVRNLEDGRVEVLVEGTQEQVDTMLAWLQHGPRGAHVSSVQHEFSDVAKEYPRFSIVPTW